ncbi:MAG: glycerate kinase [Pseudomonadota bacterium]
MPLRILIAPSGYKESLDAESVAAAIGAGALRAGDVEVVELALADGGEGTAATLARVTNGQIHRCSVSGPLGDPIESHFAMLGTVDERTAVVELAAAAGLKHVPLAQRDPLRTTTRGVGELIVAGLDAGATRVIVGCGDSGVNDGGAGIAQALGARLLDRDGNDIPEGGIGLDRIDRIDLSDLDARLATTSIEVACNIQNVLTGPNGVARLFGPQKGASPDDVERMARGLDLYAGIIDRDLGIDVRSMPGGGASGGAGAGLHALLGATLHSRFDLLFPYFDLDRAIAAADLVITAEGGLDFKTARGKIPAEIGTRGRAAGKPVIVMAGTVGDDATVVLDHGVCAYFSTVERPQTLAEAMDRTREQLELLAEHVVRAFLAGVAHGRDRSAND